MKYTNGQNSTSRLKNGLVCLVICLLPELLKCQKWLFLYFLLMSANNQSQFGENNYVHLKDLIRSFRKCYGLLDSELPLARYQPLKIQNIQFSDIPILHDSRTVTPKPIHFLKELKKILQMHLNVLLTLWLIFCCCQQKNTKNQSFFDILMTITILITF